MPCESHYRSRYVAVQCPIPFGSQRDAQAALKRGVRGDGYGEPCLMIAAAAPLRPLFSPGWRILRRGRPINNYWQASSAYRAQASAPEEYAAYACGCDAAATE
jgi:hypothetical protein